MKSKRRYHSALRREQAAGTRQRIIDAVSALVAEGSLHELSVPAVAARAGVTVRTVYRYFSTRGDLIDEMQRWALERMGALEWPRDVEELLAFPVPLFEGFDRNRALIEAQLAAAATVEAVREGREHRVRALRATLAEVIDPLPDEEQRAALGVIKHLLSAAAWRSLREDVALDATQSGRAVAWAMGVLVRDLARRAKARRGGRDESGAGRAAGIGTNGRRGHGRRTAGGARGR